MQKVKKLPQRQCVGCRERKEKRELIRVVRSPEGGISLDFKGKKPGRGRAEYARTPPHPGQEFGYQPIMWPGSHVTICGKRMHNTNTSTCSAINGQMPRIVSAVVMRSFATPWK